MYAGYKDGLPGQVKSGQDNLGLRKVKSSLTRSGQAGQVKKGQVKAVQDRSSLVQSSQIKSGQVKSSLDRSIQLRAGQVNLGKVKMDKSSKKLFLLKIFGAKFQKLLDPKEWILTKLNY